MSKFIILSTKNHPLYDKLQKLDYTFIDVERDELFETKYSNYLESEAFFDFTLLSKEKKFQLLKTIQIEFKPIIISEMGCYWGDAFLNSLPNIKGTFSTAIPSPLNKFEYTASEPDVRSYIKELFALLDLEGIKVEKPGIGFHYPRTLSMIINEAYFALEEGVATKDDIDRAMKYGVNYPKGPFEWAEEIGKDHIVMLLEQLFEATQDSRYKINPLLKMEAKRIFACT